MRRSPGTLGLMKTTWLLSLIGLSLLVSSCGDSPEDLAEDSRKLNEEMTSILEEVNEGGDADQAIEKLKGLSDELKTLSERKAALLQEEFDGNAQALQARIEEVSSDEMKEAQAEFMKELQKLLTTRTDVAPKILREIPGVDLPEQEFEQMFDQLNQFMKQIK